MMTARKHAYRHRSNKGHVAQRCGERAAGKRAPSRAIPQKRTLDCSRLSPARGLRFHPGFRCQTSWCCFFYAPTGVLPGRKRTQQIGRDKTSQTTIPTETVAEAKQTKPVNRMTVTASSCSETQACETKRRFLREALDACRGNGVFGNVTTSQRH